MSKGFKKWERKEFDAVEAVLLSKIYQLLPDYWAVWKNRFGDYSCGDVGDITSGNNVNSEATFQGNLEYIFGCVKQKFVNNKIK